MSRQDIRFNEEKHIYTYKGKELSGVTGIIGKRLNKSFDKAEGFVDIYRDFGKELHKEMEEWARSGKKPCRLDALWVVGELNKRWPGYAKLPEVLVSDYRRVASAIDLVVYTNPMHAILIDYKTGHFDREYCSFQLGFYKWMLELDGDFRVDETYVINPKSKTVFKVTPKSKERCESLADAVFQHRNNRS